MELRKAIPSDGPAIATVHVDSWRAIYDGILDAQTLEDLDVETLAQQWADAIERPETPEIRVCVLEHDERVIGYSRTGPNRDADVTDISVYEVYGFYTHPDSWGTGAGAVMMEGVVDDFSTRGINEVTLWVVDQNPRARRFYEKHGWVHEPGTSNTCFGAPEVRYRITL